MQLINIIHPQSKKEVGGVKILNKKFIKSDKRGFGTYTFIDRDFANEVMNHYKTAIGINGADIYFPDRISTNSAIKLSWSFFGNGEYSLKIHSGNSHVWSSAVLLLE